MKLIGTVLRCTTRKVNSSGKETYVTNLLVLDPENSGGTNYAVEVWDDKPHQVTPMSEIALTVTGVLSKSGGDIGVTWWGLSSQTSDRKSTRLNSSH